MAKTVVIVAVGIVTVVVVVDAIVSLWSWLWLWYYSGTAICLKCDPPQTHTVWHRRVTALNTCSYPVVLRNQSPLALLHPKDTNT